MKCRNIPHILLPVSFTLILLTWRIWWAPNNANKRQIGFNSAFKGLNCGPCTIHCPNASHANTSLYGGSWKSSGASRLTVTKQRMDTAAVRSSYRCPDHSRWHWVSLRVKTSYVTELPRSAMSCSYSLQCVAPFVVLSVRLSLFRATSFINGGLNKLAWFMTGYRSAVRCAVDRCAERCVANCILSNYHRWEGRGRELYGRRPHTVLVSCSVWRSTLTVSMDWATPGPLDFHNEKTLVRNVGNTVTSHRISPSEKPLWEP